MASCCLYYGVVLPISHKHIWRATLQIIDGSRLTLHFNHDEAFTLCRMTEICYGSPVETFQLIAKPSQVYEVDIVQGGRKALEKVNIEMGEPAAVMMEGLF